MKKTILTIFGILLFAAVHATVARADNSKAMAVPGTNEVTLGSLPDASYKPVLVTNIVRIAGEKVTYRAETGMLPILQPDGTSRASIFYVAYIRLDIPDKTRRPVMFCFNGGPGSASVWLHLGALGPRRVLMNPDGSLPPPPFSLVDNQYSILNQSDLVFIDPVATGFSRVTKDHKAAEFFGDDPDLQSVGEFIRLWTTRQERWLSPKYLCGESYGVFRAAGLADFLKARYGMYLNGLVLVSGVLDFATISGDSGNDLPYPLILPAYTAAAFYHHKLPPDLQGDLTGALAESRAFAGNEFTSDLLKGTSLAPGEREKAVRELSRLTGLKPQVIEDNNLRVDPGVFRKQLLHDEGLILGAYDARLTGRDGDPASPEPDFDPSSAAVMGPFSACMNAYVRSELNFKDDLPYELLAGVQPWNYGASNAYADASPRLAEVMNENPYLKILVFGGRCDLVCPIDTIKHSLNHMPLAPEQRKQIQFAEFDAGHMMYINLPDLVKIQKVLSAFIQP